MNHGGATGEWNCMKFPAQKGVETYLGMTRTKITIPSKQKNDIFVCSNVATGTCSFAICKKCYSIAFDDRTTRGKRSRTRSSRLVG